MTHRLKCRWCDFSVPAIYRTKSGKTNNGWPLLAAHQEDNHLAEVTAQDLLLCGWETGRIREEGDNDL